MYKLMINDTFIMNVTGFNESFNRDNPLSLSFQEILNVDDSTLAEQILLNLQPYGKDVPINNIKVLGDDEKIILDTSYFTILENANLFFHESSNLSLNILFQ